MENGLNSHLNASLGGNADTDAGLRSFLLSVYAKIGISLILSAVMAYISTIPPLAEIIHGVGADGKPTMTLIGMVITFAPLAVLLLALFARKTFGSPAGSMFLLYFVAACMGVSLGALTFIYTASSLAATLGVTSIMFLSLCLLGYVLKMDLSKFGPILLMLLVGLIVATVVNIFLKSSGLDAILTYAGVLLFSALTVYDSQRAKMAYYEANSSDELATAGNMCALNLYLDFINLFLYLLKILGQKD